MGKSTISMAIFNSYIVLNYQGYPIQSSIDWATPSHSTGLPHGLAPETRSDLAESPVSDQGGFGGDARFQTMMIHDYNMFNVGKLMVNDGNH
jgi:hypothetical protein